jgi:localization factor PodJL
MTEALRPTFISLLLITTGALGLASYVESQRHIAPGSAHMATRLALPLPTVAPPQLAEAPRPVPEAAAARKPAPIAALPPLPVPKPRAIQPLAAEARHGDAEAQYQLALAYAARSDWNRAAAWFREAAIAGVPEARLRLAEQYRLGRGLPANPLESFIWTKSAAEQGLPAAQLALGDAYERGLGVPPMPVEAYVWYILAAQSGAAKAEPRRDALAARLGAQERKTAEARAASLAAALAPSTVPNRHLVAEIQRLLRAKGYDAGLDDGLRGERTTDAIRRYQEKEGLPIDGEPSETLLERLRAAVRPPPPPPVE